MKIEWAQFFAKYLVIAVSAIWLLVTGTDYIVKQSSALDLKNKRLSRKSIGVVTHELSMSYNFELWGSNKNLCSINGKYVLENTGELPVVFNAVSFSIYALPPISESELNENGIISNTLSLQIQNLTPIHTETISQIERVGTDGQLERNYAFTITKTSGYLYGVVANAIGGLSTTEGSLDKSNMFGDLELQHFYFADICPERPPNSESLPPTNRYY